MTFSELGERLVVGRRRLDAGEAEWLAELVEFDRSGLWALDGHTCCVSWLVDHCGLRRSTAHEKVRIGYELARRPLVAEALAEGELSYSKIRALTRVANTDEETDRVLVETARDMTAADVERVARHFELLDEQERPTDAMARAQRRGLHGHTRHDGMGVIEAVLPIENQQRVLEAVDAVVDESSAEGGAIRAQRRADALCDLVEAGLAHLSEGGIIDPQLAVINVICDYDTLTAKANGTAAFEGGAPLRGEAARRLACEAGYCRIIVKGRSEVLDVGRQTRQWNQAQRRAIRFRHRGRCAFPGCDHRITQIHHCQPWGQQGRTDLDAGVPVCWAHHHLVHEGGWSVTYDGPTSTAIFTSPHGDQIKAPAPPTPAAA